MTQDLFTKKKQFEDILKDNDIIQDAFKGKSPDSGLYTWLGADILKLSYIKFDLNMGKSVEEVAKYYSVSEEGIYKYVLKEDKKEVR